MPGPETHAVQDTRELLEPGHPYNDGLRLPGRCTVVLLTSSRNRISMEHAGGHALHPWISECRPAS